MSSKNTNKNNSKKSENDKKKKLTENNRKIFRKKILGRLCCFCGTVAHCS